jgi:hypothetical protein
MVLWINLSLSEIFSLIRTKYKLINQWIREKLFNSREMIFKSKIYQIIKSSK